MSFTAHGHTSDLPCVCERCWSETQHILIACQACGEEVKRGDLKACWPHTGSRSYLMCPACLDSRSRWLLVAVEDGGRGGAEEDAGPLARPGVRLRPSGLTRVDA